MVTQQDIAGWCWQTFGMPESVDVIVDRAITEMIEMEMAREDGDHGRLIEEAADAVIVLKHLAEYVGYDLEATIAAKMAINRERSWQCHGNGDGTHLPSENDGQRYAVPVDLHVRPRDVHPENRHSAPADRTPPLAETPDAEKGSV